MEMTERTSERLLTAEDIGNKINLTENQFTELVDKLQKRTKLGRRFVSRY